MEPPRQKWFARLGLVAVTLFGLLWLGHLNFSEKISTNVVDLIPTDQRSPELSLVRSLANEEQSRVVLFALSSPAQPKSPPEEAARQFAEELRTSKAFAEVVAMNDSSARDALGRFIYERRLDLLFPSWLAEKRAAFLTAKKPAEEYSAWLAEQAAAGLDRFLSTPESAAFQNLVPNDPLLLVPELVQKTQIINPTPNQPSNLVLLWARIDRSPFSEEGQEPVFAAIEKAYARAKTTTSDLKMEWTGVNRFAAESKTRIRQELSTLNLLSLAGVVAVACLFVRKIWKVLHLVPVVLLSVLGAWTVATMSFSHLHILVFVVGALLTGLAIDYGCELCRRSVQPPDEPYL